ncbi:nucleoside monophosphate kinase [Spirillospora sp. NPDC052269]
MGTSTQLRILMIAAPGTCKEQPASLLASRLSLPKISPGNALRVNLRDRTDLGQQAKAFMACGDLMPDELIIAMVREQLALDRAREGFVLDGFPRTVPQAHAFDQMLAAEFHAGLDLVLRPAVDYEQVLRQQSGRRTCSRSAALACLRRRHPGRPLR